MQREVAPGDIFEVAFEQSYNPSNEPVGVPRLVYVSLRTATMSRSLYRFTPPNEREAGWFDGNGSSTVRALMRTPVDSARISSQFGMRTHPILGYQKLHRGTDFAAPTGTPVFASGNATVEFAGPKGANGNFIRLHHDNGWQTLYLHLNRILPGVAPGSKVLQGQQIGEIGTTGRSTGPHLHYEVHIDGQPVDPLQIQMGEGKSLSGPALTAFHKQRDAIDTQRATAKY
jgi:murein DD-endopeptidase MepM/ murein hydrolase activator NlpD